MEDVYVRGLAGTPGHEITIQSFPGERAVIDSGIRDFRIVDNSQWVPASTVVDVAENVTVVSGSMVLSVTDDDGYTVHNTLE